MTEEAKPKAVSAAAWKKAKVHEGVTLPSGAVVDITVPNLSQLIAGGQLPNSLIDAAMQLDNSDDEKVDPKRRLDPQVLKDTWDFVKFVVPLTVAKPQITSDDVDDIPIEDAEMITSFATRRNDIDALGHHLGGLETHRRFRELRGLITLDEALADIDSSGEAVPDAE